MAAGTAAEAAKQLRQSEGGSASVTESRLPLQGNAVLLQLPDPEQRGGDSAVAAARLPSISEEGDAAAASAEECALLLWAHAGLLQDVPGPGAQEKGCCM